MKTPVLELQNVSRTFRRRRGLAEIFTRRDDEKNAVRAVKSISLSLVPGRVLGIVGESGSGKSTLANMLVGLEKPDEGALLFRGLPVNRADRAGFRVYRRAVQMVFQDPFGSLNPRFSIGRTVEEPLAINRIGNAEERRRRAIAALEEAELRPGADYYGRYPHELSGGQRQRVAIARALVLEPEVLVADEPVSMLDVSVRASILRVLKDLVRNHDMALAFITHDLSLVGLICDEVAVVYKGDLVEHGAALDILQRPQHAYTRSLIAAIPLPDPRARSIGAPHPSSRPAAEAGDIAADQKTRAVR